jgi:hypothetical protein
MAEIIFNIIGGTPDYTVELIPDIGTTWTFGSAGIKTISPIPAGNYHLMVTDANGCIKIKGGIVIPIPPPPEVTTTTTSCGDYVAILTVGSPGEGSYGYQVDAYGSIDPVDTNIVSIGWVNDQIPNIFTTVLGCYDEITLYVNDVPYVLSCVGGDEIFTYRVSNANPFPGVGETCNVRLCYGIQCTTTTEEPVTTTTELPTTTTTEEVTTTTTNPSLEMETTTTTTPL